MILNCTAVKSDPLVLRLDSLDAITPEVIGDIVDGDPLLVVVPGVIDQNDAGRIADLLVAAEWGTYSAEIGAAHIGTLKAFETLFGCFGDRMCANYFELADTRMRLLGKLLRPFQNPAQMLLDHLNEVWPHGADVLIVDGRRCYVGLPRLFSDGGQAEMHTDRADWDLPSDTTSAIKAQLAFNFCMSQTNGEDSGSLKLWPDVPDKASYDRLRRTDVPYALDESQFAHPLVTYRPEPGDLYIFNAFRPHAVTSAFGGGVRVTVSGFVDYFGMGAPLRAHS